MDRWADLAGYGCFAFGCFTLTMYLMYVYMYAMHSVYEVGEPGVLRLSILKKTCS